MIYSQLIHNQVGIFAAKFNLNDLIRREINRRNAVLIEINRRNVPSSTNVHRRPDLRDSKNLFIIMSNSNRLRMQKYNPILDVWKTDATLYPKNPIESFGLSMVNGNVYLIGGLGDKSSMNTVYMNMKQMYVIC